MKLSATGSALVALVGFVILYASLSLLVSYGAVVGSFLFGWLLFILRVWPAVTVNWSGVGMVLLCSILIIAGLHSLSRWLFGSVAARVAACAGMQWRLSWSFALYAAIWLLFAAIMGAVGVAHQVGWLVRSHEPFYKLRRDPSGLRDSLKNKALTLFYWAEYARWDLETTKREFLKDEAKHSSDRPNVFEDLHVVFFEGNDGKLAGSLIFHRDPKTQVEAGFVEISRWQLPGEAQPINGLSIALARYGAQATGAPAGQGAGRNK